MNKPCGHISLIMTGLVYFQQHGMYNMMGVPPGSQAGYGNQQQMQQMQYQQVRIPSQ